MKKLLAVLLTVSLGFSCAVISAGAAIAPKDYWFGDVDRDDFVTIEDVTAVQRYLAEMVTWTYDYRYQADYNHDNIVSVKDVTEMQRAVAEFPQPEGYGGCYMYTNYLIQSVHSDYASDTMPAGIPVTFTVQSLQGETFVFCVNNTVAQPRSTSKTFTYTFTEPGSYEICIYALNETGFRSFQRFPFDYHVAEAVSDTDVRINCLWGEQSWDSLTYFAQYGATGGTAPYTYSLVIKEAHKSDDAAIFNAYAANHETDWQMRYNDKKQTYEFFRDFSPENCIWIDEEMLNFEYYDHTIIVQAKDAQGDLSNTKELIVRSLSI